MPAKRDGRDEPSAPSAEATRDAFDTRARNAIAIKEHAVDLERGALGATIGTVAWTLFAAIDFLQAELIGTGHLRELLILRVMPIPILLYVTVLARRRPAPTAGQLRAWLVVTMVTLSLACSLMSIYTGGFGSPYAVGLLISNMGFIFVPRPFKETLRYVGLSLSMYPLSLFTSALFLPHMRAQLDEVEVLVRLVQFHVVGIMTGTFIAGVTHILFTMRKELFESRSVGRYRLKRRLGVGGMGEVWAAYHHGLERNVAVKILTNTSESEHVAARRFEREIRATSELVHPNTIRIYDFGTAEDGRLYYAMELLEGESLATLVEREGPLSVARAVHFIRQAARALAEAHAHWIVHRDVKAENFFVTTNGEAEDFIKVLDFGIATVKSDSNSTLTRAGAVAGSPGTMSPEVILNQKATPASDVYGLGAVLYLLVTGRLPFAHAAGSAMLVAHVNEAPVSPSIRLRAKIDPDVEAIIMRCLAKDPSDRYPTAHELAEALEGCSVAGTWRGAPSLVRPARKQLEVVPSVEVSLDPIPLVVRRFPGVSEPPPSLFEDEETSLYARRDDD
jgi:serine/threonine protein kinase